jgi:pSer/pThr/pTyr-binding forkhead associated (FHA) protein
VHVVLVMFKGDERRDFPVTEERSVIGRRQDCQLRIPTRDVSRQHCELLKQNNELLVKDLGSSNGTFVNGKRIAESPLKAGDRLRIGPVAFVVQIDGQPPTKEIKPDAGAPGEVVPTTSAPPDEETFDLTEADFDADDALSALDDLDDDEKTMP